MLCVLRWLVGLWTVVLIAVSTPVQAQERPLVELVSVDRDAGMARVRVRLGGRVSDINRIVRRLIPESGFRVDMEAIAGLNEGRTITVCYDQLPGERPYMSRAPEAWNACQHFPRSRWLIAEVTYLVPIRAARARIPLTLPPVRNARELELERRLAVMERELVESDEAVIASMTHEDSLHARIEELDDVQATNARLRAAAARGSDRIRLAVIAMLLALIALCIVLYLLRKRWQTRVMIQVRRLNRAWSLYRLGLQKKLSLAEHEIGMLRRGITETSGELAQARTRQGQLRTRVHAFIVQLRENRNLLIAASQLIQEFQRRRQEDDDRRTRLPKLLQSVDDARLHQLSANNARARQDLVLDWVRFLRKSPNAYPKVMRRTLLGTYRRMLGDYRRDRLYHEVQASLLAEDRAKAIEDLHALTGVRMERVDPESRLKRSLDAADKNAEILEARSKALAGLIAAHIALQDEFSNREQAIAVREGHISGAEAELVARMQAHDARVATWEKEHEVKKALDLWTGGLVKAEAASQLTDVDRRMTELEARVRGLTFRAEESEDKLRLNDDFIQKVQREYREAKELLEGIKKGPNFLEARFLQMAEYIKMLEEKLGIQRSSIFTGLPDVPYGANPSKAKA